ncbi:MAG: FAD binding domain-containing protein [Anaerolineae bacterium]|nr:FAD binding domain-containing protein [Anaerolineae bacterium]
MREFEYYQPKTNGELLAALALDGARVVAGGTDIIPRWRKERLSATCLVDISAVGGLRFIREEEGVIEIGALSTHADLIASPLIQNKAPLLAQAAASVGCTQTRQRGTLGGNLVNASPAADLAPALLALNASAWLMSAESERCVPLAEFWLGPGKTVLTPGEFLRSVTFLPPQGACGLAFAKLGKRSGMAIAVASAAAYLVLDERGNIHTARLALGSLAPMPKRSPAAETLLTTAAYDEMLADRAASAALIDISPIDDVRASAAYRRLACKVLVERVLKEAYNQALGRLS